jgi:glycosyltransferase involved in cell wall biosynthesis
MMWPRNSGDLDRFARILEITLNFLLLETLGYESPLRVSGHHYARALVGRGHRVVSLSSPVTPFHRFARSGRAAIAARFDNHRRGFVRAPTGAHHYVPLSWIPVKRPFPFGTPLALRLAAASFERDALRRLRHMKFAPDVIAIQSMMFAPLLRRFPDALVLLRITDRMESFPDIPPAFLHYEKELIDKADLISITSQQFEAKIPPAARAKVLHLPNAVDADRFARPRPRPREYESIAEPIAVYIGSLRVRFDADLTLALLRARRDFRFFVISPDAPRADLLTEPNFHYIPGVPYEETPAYYQHAAVGFIPFRTDLDVVRSASSLKVLECLAAGTPLVCADWPEPRALGAPVVFAADAPAFAAALAEAAGKPPPPETPRFLAAHSWDRNLDRLMERIESLATRASTSNSSHRRDRV